MIAGAAALGNKLRAWIENGGSREDAAEIANALHAATTMTDILILIRSIGMQLAADKNNVWHIADNRQHEVLTFRFVENPVGHANITIL